MAFSLTGIGSPEDVPALVRNLQKIFSDLEEQLQVVPSILINNNPNKALKNPGKNDLSIDFNADGTVSFRFVKPDRSYFVLTFNTDLNGFKGNTSAAAAASTTQYPTSGDWGWHTDTAGATLKLVRNVAGVIKSSAAFT